MAEAVAEMIDAPIALGVGRGNSRNERVNEFMRELLERSDPVNLDFPQDRDEADGGVRAANIRRINRACEELIRIEC